MSDHSNKRIFLITGASRGIGAAVAKSLASEDNHLILMARTISALEDVHDAVVEKGGTATILPADISKLDDIDNLGPTIMERFGKLDVLISNAATLGPLSPIGHIDEKAWNTTIDTNLNAQFRLIRTLDPLLKQSENGRAVFVTSGLGNETHLPFWAPYSVTKAGLQALVKSYAAETENTNLRVNLISPGVVNTKMIAKAFPGGYQGDMKEPEDVTDAFRGLVSVDCTRHGECICL